MQMNAIFQFKQLFSNNVSFNFSTLPCCLRPISFFPHRILMFLFGLYLFIYLFLYCILKQMRKKMVSERKASPKQNSRHNCNCFCFGIRCTKSIKSVLRCAKQQQNNASKFTMNKLHINRGLWCFCKIFNGFTLVFLHKYIPNSK